MFRVPVSEGLADVKMEAPIGLITADMVAPCAGVKPKGRLGRVTSRRAADSRRPVLPRSRRTTERGLLGSRAQSRVCPPQWSARLQLLWRWQTPGQVEICRASGAVVTHAWTLDCLHETGYSALSVTLGSMAFHDEILCLGRGRSHAVSMPGRPGRHTGQDQRGGEVLWRREGPPATMPGTMAWRPCRYPPRWTGSHERQGGAYLEEGDSLIRYISTAAVSRICMRGLCWHVCASQQWIFNWCLARVLNVSVRHG